jgi:hypothetical protein
MAMFLLLPAVVLLCVVLLAPLMFPGAVVAVVVLGLAELVRRHRAERVLHPH